MDTMMLVWIAVIAVAIVLLVLFLKKSGRPNYAKMSSEQLTEVAEHKAELYRQQHKSSTGKEIDCTRESLADVDTVLEKNFAHNTLDDATIDHLGMFLGETLRRTFGGHWRFNEGFGELCLDLPEEGFIFPVSQIRRALEHKETGQIVSYVESIAERHAAAQGKAS